MKSVRVRRKKHNRLLCAGDAVVCESYTGAPLELQIR